MNTLEAPLLATVERPGRSPWRARKVPTAHFQDEDGGYTVSILRTHDTDAARILAAGHLAAMGATPTRLPEPTLVWLVKSRSLGGHKLAGPNASGAIPAVVFSFGGML